MTAKRKPSAPCGNVSTVGNAPSPNARPLVELRNVKHAEFASHETACFEATVYVDGRKFCVVSNEGMGGADRFEPVKGGGALRDLDAAMLDVAKRINPLAIARYTNKAPIVTAVTDEEFEAMYAGAYWERGERTAEEIFEGLCGRLLADHLIGKDLARAFKTRVIFTLPDGRLMECKMRGNAPEAVCASVKLRNPGAVILNEKPLAEAVAIMRERGE